MNRIKTALHRVAKRLRRHWLLVTICLVAATIILIMPLTYTYLSTRGQRYDLAKQSIRAVPYHRVAIVFGAGIFPDRTPTPYLKNRLDTAVNLYKAKKVSKLLMTGDNSTVDHNEPIVMMAYAHKHGVPIKDIAVDDGGFNTYDSCYRAHAIFKLNDATLITQGYHLPRAMVTCKGLGVQTSGVIAQHKDRDFTVSYITRELASTDKMTLQLLTKPKPTVLGPPLPIR